MMNKSKEDIRRNIFTKRKVMTDGIWLQKSLQIAEKLKSLEEYKNAKTVMFYVSKGKEVFTHDIVKDTLKEKDVAVPLIKDKMIVGSRIVSFDELSEGNFGVLEPSEVIELGNIDIVIVPGVAFDKKLNRIGYGMGYYDNFLPKINAKRIGFAFDLQIVDSILKSKHDIPMDMIITESRILR